MTDAPAKIPVNGVSDHARERMVEYLGRDLTDHEWSLVVMQILNREALLIRIQGRNSELLRVEIGGVPFTVAWRPMGATIATVLPPNGSLSRVEHAVRRRKMAPRLKFGARMIANPLVREAPRRREDWEDDA